MQATVYYGITYFTQHRTRNKHWNVNYASMIYNTDPSLYYDNTHAELLTRERQTGRLYFELYIILIKELSKHPKHVGLYFQV